MDAFLIDRDPITWTPTQRFPKSLTAQGLFTQKAPHGLEVVFATAPARPKVSDLRTAHKIRKDNRASPVLIAVAYPRAGGASLLGERRRTDGMALCGPGGDPLPCQFDIEPSQAERLVAAALDTPDRHSATRLLAAHMPELAAADDLTQLPLGLRNSGLLATHELRFGVPQRPDWHQAVAASKPLLRPAGRAGSALNGRTLVGRLGFTVQRLTSTASVLTVNGRNQAVAVFCNDDEPFDAPARRLASNSPVSLGLAEADRHNLDWVILTRSSEIRLYAAKTDTGVGRKGRSESFVELNLALLPEDQAGYLHLLFSAAAFTEGTLTEILRASGDFAADLAERLRERVYFETVPALARAVAARLGHEPSSDELTDAYEQVMVILFRLLFVAYAEDKGLLPYRSNDNYDHHSLKQIANRLLEDRRKDRERFDHRASSLWEDVTILWRAVDKGNSRLGVPAYNGGLFTDDPEVFATGAALAEMALSDADFGPALVGLLIDDGPEGEGLVDFRSLSVREFGTIYEGLLESRLALAASDLTVTKGKRKAKSQQMHAPAGEGDPVEVQAGHVYLHNRSGIRKSTGSYFTKPFAVEHLLDEALEPALDDHIARLGEFWNADDDAALSKAFFDFRCADIAMGSGHFLVAALDRIEARLSKWLTDHPVPAVTAQLDRLHKTASEALEEMGALTEIEYSALLRRQVVRHCVYGVDRQQVAVELARLAVWIHTFVPGLPLSFLDHNLVCGDSLTGVGSLHQVTELLEPDTDPDTPSFTSILVREALEKAEPKLTRLAITADADKAEIDKARQAHREARAAVAGAEALFDLFTAHCVDPDTCKRPESFEEYSLISAAATEAVRAAIKTHRPLHFPTTFPEVFLRDRPGFDCLFGNPPWEEVTVERTGWWGRYLPGIRGGSVQKTKAAIDRLERQRPDLAADYKHDIKAAAELRHLLRKAYRDLGPGDTDLHKAFAWRFWQLAVTAGGRVGIVLPRSALSDTGNALWRRTVLAAGTFANVTVLENKAGWVFEDVAPKYTVSLCSLCKGRIPDAFVNLSGPFASHDEYQSRVRATKIPIAEFESWSKTASFPLLPTAEALGVYRRLKSHPRLDGTAGGIGPIDINTHTHTHTHYLIVGKCVRWPSCTPQRTSPTWCSTVALPPGPRTRRDQRQAQIRPRLRAHRSESHCEPLARLRREVLQHLASRHWKILRLS